MKKTSPTKVMAVLRSWLKMYDFQWGKQYDPEVLKAWFGAFSESDPENLESALKKAWETSKWYPTPEDVKFFLRPAKIQGIAWITPHGGECIASSFYAGEKLKDGREVKCACRDCRPDLSWCQWQFSDGSFCSRFNRNGNPYCPQHHHAASEHFEIFTLDVDDQVAFLKNLRNQGQIPFVSYANSTVIRGADLGPCSNRHEFQACLAKLVSLRGMHDLGGALGNRHQPGSVDRPAGKVGR